MSIYKQDNNEILTQSDGKVYSDIPNGENDFYYHRYKDDGNKKLYLSSKYLKDAVIDSDNKIEVLKSSVGSGLLSQNTAISQPTLTNKGVRILNATRLSSINDSELCPKGNSDFTFGIWAKNERVKSVEVIFACDCFLIYILNGTSLNTRIIDSTNTQHNDRIAISNIDNTDYHYYFFIRLGDNLYSFIDGVLVKVYALPTSLLLYEFNDVVVLPFTNASQAMEGYVDDFLISHEAEINPLGYAIGHKVFEPPRRGGFDSEIKQY